MVWSRGRLLIVAAFAVGYAFFIAWYHAPYAGSSDASGYLNSARLLLAGELSAPVRVPDGFPAEIPRTRLLPLGFRLDATQQNLLPTYPVGLPLHFAALGMFFGLGPATTAVAVLSALAFAFLLYLTAREFGVGTGGSASVAVLAALSPLTLHFALQPMSDLVAATWATAVILLALRSNRHAGWAAGAGAAFAVAVLVRPTNLLLIVPAALALAARPRSWIAFGLGGLPGAAFLAWYHHRLFGSIFASGYGDVRSLFSLGYLPRSLWHYVQWIPVVVTPLVLAAALLPRVSLDRRRKIILLAWAGVILFFYSAYDCSYETWWYLRFILPALPALGIAAALVLQSAPFPSWTLVSHVVPAGGNATRPGPVFRLSVPFGLTVLAVAWSLAWSRTLRATQVEIDDRDYPLAARWVAEQLPPDGVLVAYQLSGAVFYYTDRPFLSPVEFQPEDNLHLNAWLAARHRVLYAALYPDEESLVREKLPGQWEPVTHLRRVTIWRRR